MLVNSQLLFKKCAQTATATNCGVTSVDDIVDSTKEPQLSHKPSSNNTISPT